MTEENVVPPALKLRQLAFVMRPHARSTPPLSLT